MESLLKRIGCPYRKNAALREYSSWRIGGPADWIAEPGSTAQLSEILASCHAGGLPFLIIGHGTNLLFDDRGFRGVIVRLANNFSDFTIEGNRIWAQAGVWVPRLARLAGRAGLSGLQHTVGIPGTLGGLVVMNGGSQRKAIGNHITTVLAMDRQGVCQRFTRAACEFSYRSSVFQKSGHIIVEVELACDRGDRGALGREMLTILRDRDRKFPRKLPNCGSVFVSGGEMYDQFGPPGKVIEDSGLKGLRIGDAQISPRHANFIVNLDKALSVDVLALIKLIRDRVFERTGYWLETEVRYVSPDGSVQAASEVLALT